MNTHRMRLAATGLMAAWALAGCWGGDNSNNDSMPPAANAEVPDSAGVNSAAFFTFILMLSATDESSEPLTIKDSFTVPADESAEPTPLT